MQCVLHVAFLHWRYVLIGRAEIWLDWLKDEIGLVEGDEAEREKIYELFEKAVTDYICKRGTVSVKRLNEQWSDSLAHTIASSEISLMFFFLHCCGFVFTLHLAVKENSWHVVYNWPIKIPCVWIYDIRLCSIFEFLIRKNPCAWLQKRLL